MDFGQDYYTILGVSSSASPEEVQQAFRKAARLFHPDTNQAPGAELLFKDINTAYQVLSNYHERSRYDEVMRERLAEMPGIYLETHYSRQHLQRLDEPQLLYTLVKLRPYTEVSTPTSAPLNLSLIVDQSTSMKGERLQSVKSAVHRLIDEMGTEDVISIIAFSDRAEILIPSQRKSDPRYMKAMVSTLRASGATAILSGLEEGLKQIERKHHSKYVNHMVLITDGRTYGDEEQCLELASNARDKGISISGMGIGEDWNDQFLDDIATITGGSSAYVANSEAVIRFLEERVRSLATAFAERARMVVVPAPGAQLSAVTRIAPNAMSMTHGTQPIVLGAIDSMATTSLLLQFQLNTSDVDPGDFLVGRVDVSADVLGAAQRVERAVQDLVIQVSDKEVEEEPPPEILDALSHLMLYRLQDRARQAIQAGNIEEATRKLESLATRLFEHGEDALGNTALTQAQQLTATRALSEEGAKQLKYGTRALLLDTQIIDTQGETYD